MLKKEQKSMVAMTVTLKEKKEMKYQLMELKTSNQAMTKEAKVNQDKVKKLESENSQLSIQLEDCLMPFLLQL